MLKLKKLSLKTISVLLPFAVSTFGYAQNDIELKNENYIEANQPVNMEHYGVPKYLPKLAISSMLQGDHVVEHARKKETLDGETQESEVYLVQTTDNKGNIDLRIKYDPTKVDESTNLIDSIEKMTKSEYKLRQYAEMYDKQSVVVTELENGDLEIEFDYSKYTLPQDIAYFRFMRGKVLISEGQPVSLIITNNNPFKQDDYSIDTYKQITFFDNLPNGRVVVNKKLITAKGEKKKKALELEIEMTPVVYYDDQLGAVVQDESLLSVVSDPRMREEYVDLDRTFPLMADMVRKQGIDVPLPFGISASYRRQEMDFNFTDFTIGGVPLEGVVNPENTVAHVVAEAYTVRGDVNILPFWNVFGYVGQIDVEAMVDAQTQQFDLPVIGPIGPYDFSVPVKLQYDLLGVGTTLSMGYKQFFGSVTSTYSMTRLKGSTADWGDGIVTVQPMLGYQLADYRAQIFVGAEYQALKPRMTGDLAPALGLDSSFEYDVGVNLEKWAYLVGVNKQIGKHYNMTFLYNKGETRNSFTINLGYHF
ncbi:hypothetical protein [Vibrio methylphosphonaticus]|uniref:hypothetical protein n=1 Tax=Vibrio methylphosphonaticus TaxID=2946866 RepID=UPI00202A4E33|nr:hypothetical protein [Vibrio methylphosphonaticus]MCL9773921.1 hypothetical protein [Vibrio methylphosphonaticus]